MQSAFLDAPRELHPGVEGLWSDDEVTPPRNEQSRRATDVSRLTFPLQLVIVIVAGVVSVYGATWAANWKQASDIRDMHTMMEMQERVNVEKAKAQELRDTSLHDQLKAVQDQISAAERRQELLRLEFQQLREQVLFKGKAAR